MCFRQDRVRNFFTPFVTSFSNWIFFLSLGRNVAFNLRSAFFEPICQLWTGAIIIKIVPEPDNFVKRKKQLLYFRMIPTMRFCNGTQYKDQKINLKIGVNGLVLHADKVYLWFNTLFPASHCLFHFWTILYVHLDLTTFDFWRILDNRR